MRFAMCFFTSLYKLKVKCKKIVYIFYVFLESVYIVTGIIAFTV